MARLRVLSAALPLAGSALLSSALLSSALLSSALLGCARDATPLNSGSEGRILEMRQLTGENIFSRNVYACEGCSLEQFAAIEVPDGWEKGVPKRAIPELELTNAPLVPGVPVELDYVTEVPGAEFAFVAQVVDGNVVGAEMAVAAVARATIFRYGAGAVLHELTDDQGNVYVLFAVAEELFADPGFTLDDVEAFAELPLPTAWSYQSRQSAEPLEVDSGGLALVFSHSRTTTWQRYPVP